MCVGCDIGQLYPYLQDYFEPYQKTIRQMKSVEHGLLKLSELDYIHLEHGAILDKHHKRLVRIRREWGRAHHTLAKEITEHENEREKEKARSDTLRDGEAVQG